MILISLLAHGAEDAGWQLPPLHPFLVNFTAALIPLSVLSDWLGRFLKNDSLNAAAWWMMVYAAVVTPFTAAAGWWWRIQGNHPVDGTMWWHQWLGTSMAVVAVGLVLWRWRLRRAARTPGVGYLAAATLAVAVLVVQAELGAQMSFGAGAEAKGHSENEGGDTDPAHTQGESAMPGPEKDRQGPDHADGQDHSHK